MQGLRKIGTLLFCLGMGACQAPESSGLLPETSTTRLVEVAPILSPKERALMNKVANRTLLQEVVDQAPPEQLQHKNFACSPQNGGLVVYVHKEEELRGIRLSISEEKAGRSTRWYYQNEKAALVAHEQSQWRGEEEYIEQTVFYLDGKELLQVLYRVVQAPPNSLETVLEQTTFEQVPANKQAQLWEQLKKEEEQLSTTTKEKDYHHYFCP